MGSVVYTANRRGVAYKGGLRVAAHGTLATNIQLLNPTGSGKIIYLDQITASRPTSVVGNTGVTFGWYHTALTDNITTVLPCDLRATQASIGILSSQYATIVALLPVEVTDRTAIPDSSSYLFRFQRPVILSPGKGVICHTGVIYPLDAYFEWLEMESD